LPTLCLLGGRRGEQRHTYLSRLTSAFELCARVPAAVVAKKWAVAWGPEETERTSDRVLGIASADFSPPLRDHFCAFFVEEFRSVSELP
jgi:hypothetical protein